MTRDVAAAAGTASASGSILVVDDEERILEVVARGLSSEGYEVDVRANAHQGLEAALGRSYDLVILDLLMPGLPGITVLDRIVQHRPGQVVIVLSCLGDSTTRVQCFQLGAADYVPKPFSLQELVERVKARLRAARTEPRPLEVGDLRVDLVRRRVQVDGRPVALTEREFLLLWELTQHPGRTVSKDHLLDAVWGYRFEPGSNVVDVYVARLRQKLGAGVVVTVRGGGYRIGPA